MIKRIIFKKGMHVLEVFYYSILIFPYGINNVLLSHKVLFLFFRKRATGFLTISTT